MMSIKHNCLIRKTLKNLENGNTSSLCCSFPTSGKVYHKASKPSVLKNKYQDTQLCTVHENNICAVDCYCFLNPFRIG